MEAPESNNRHLYRIPSYLPQEVFRDYDIRGLVGDNGLTIDFAYALGRAIGNHLWTSGQDKIFVAKDGRLSGTVLMRALCVGLEQAGLGVLNIGMVPTPVLYFAASQLEPHSGIMVTASHNPKDHNGFKIILQGKTLTTEAIQQFKQAMLDSGKFSDRTGYQKNVDVLEAYASAIFQRIHLQRPLKIVVDCGNGVAGLIAPRIYERLGCEVIPLYCEVDGQFPNHHPDPTIIENLRDLRSAVIKHQADVGLAFDGDADRLGVVTDRGEIIWPDRQMMLFAREVLSHVPGSSIIFDVKCSRHLPQIIQLYGGHPLMCRTGHSLLKQKLLEVGAPLAGEMSGHIFFNDEWFGFDDGIYVGARLLRLLSRDKRRTSEVFEDLPNSYNTPELKLPIAESEKKEFMTRLLQEGDFEDGTVSTLDGIRIDFSDGWGLVRPSNTSAFLILRFEADTPEALQRIQNLFRTQLLKINSGLKLPF